MNVLHPCPSCKNKNIIIMATFGKQFYGTCKKCHLSSDNRGGIDDAGKCWNEMCEKMKIE